MKRKIDVYFFGEYICSTNQSRSCKEAVDKYLEKCKMNKSRLGGQSVIERMIEKYPYELKARFSK